MAFRGTPPPGRRFAATALLCVSTALGGCHAGRALRALPPGGTAAELSVPGVWLESPGRFPVGAPVLGVRRGLTPTTEGTLRWNPGVALLGLVALDVGGTWHALPARGPLPGLHVGAELSGLVAPAHLHEGVAHGLRAAVAVEATAHWEPTGWCSPYVVAQNAVVLADGTIVVSSFSGAQFAFGERWSLSAELGWAGLNLPRRDYSIGYLDLGGRGALWMGWSVGYRFGAGGGGP